MVVKSGYNMEIPKNSLLYLNNLKYDYIDSYEYVLTDLKNKIGILEVAQAFAKPGPKWFEKLFTLRNKIVSIFKLKTPNNIRSEDSSDINKWEVGKQAGIFKIFSKTATEIILGEDDRHLNVRVSLLLDQNKDKENEKIVTVTTVVEINNRLGRIYFFIVKPFHKTIIPFLLKRAFKQLELDVG